MKVSLKAYKSSLILLGSIILGGILGVVLGPKTSVLKPFGDIFLNLMFMIIIPLVFFSVSSAIANMRGMKRLGKIMASVFIVFLITAFIAAIVGVIAALIMNPTKNLNHLDIKHIIGNASNTLEESKKLSIVDQLVNTFTVSDFSLLLSKKNMLQLIVFSMIFGIATVMSKEKGKPVARFLSSGSAVTMNMVKIIMYYAPIGLGCYFASIIGSLGMQILQGYIRVFIIYIILTLLYYFVFFTLYAFIAGGKDGVKIFWKNALAPTVTSLATCSSAACIPVNLESVKKMGVPKDIAETMIPLGANIHKDGSVFGGVMKIVFLFGLLGRDMTSVTSILGIIFISFLVGAVMGAIPSGGMIGEMLIISVYGFSPEVLPIIAVISAIIDAPATLLNSTGNTVCSMMATRIVEGKDWIKTKVTTKGETF